MANYGKYVSAVVFCGGSAYGLAAASGVTAGLRDSGAASVKWGEVAVVPAYTLLNSLGTQF